MFICKECKSKRIKTRSNTTFGKTSTVSAVNCKDCGSTSLIEVEERKQRR